MYFQLLLYCSFHEPEYRSRHSLDWKMSRTIFRSSLKIDLTFVIFSIITVNKIAIIKVKRIVFAHPWIFWNYIVLVNSPIFTYQYQWYYDIIKIYEILLSLTSIQTPKPALKLTKPPVCCVIFESSFTLFTFEIKRLWSSLKCLKAPEAV